MALHVIRGATGLVALPNGNNLWVSSIQVNAGNELLDVSHFGGSGYRVRTYGLGDLSGSCVAFLTAGATGTNPFAITGQAPAVMTITYEAGCTVSFMAVIGQLQIVGEYQGLQVATFNFSNGADVAPTVVWSST